MRGRGDAVKRVRFVTGGVVLGLSLLATLAVSSCADSDDAVGAGTLDGAVGIDDGGDVDGSTDAQQGAEGGCEAGSPSCGPAPLDCTEADFCPVSSPLDRRFSLTAVGGSGPSDVWAVGSGGTAMHWNGSAWSLVDTGTPDTLQALWVGGPTNLWAVASSATMLHGDGRTFTNEPAFPPDVFAYPGRLHAVWGKGAQELRAGGVPFMADLPAGSLPGNLLRRPVTDPDAGLAWEVESGVDGRFAQATVRAIWGSSERDVWIALDNGQEEPWARGTVAHGTAASAGDPLTWAVVDSRSSSPLEALWGSSASDVWAVGESGVIRHFTGGPSFVAVPGAPTHQALHGVWGSGPSDVWVVGDGGTILHFDGAAWTTATAAFPLGDKPDLRGVWGSGPNDVWVVGDAFTLHFTGKKSGR